LGILNSFKPYGTIFRACSSEPQAEASLEALGLNLLNINQCKILADFKLTVQTIGVVLTVQEK